MALPHISKADSRERCQCHENTVTRQLTQSKSEKRV